MCLPISTATAKNVLYYSRNGELYQEEGNICFNVTVAGHYQIWIGCSPNELFTQMKVQFEHFLITYSAIYGTCVIEDIMGVKQNTKEL